MEKQGVEAQDRRLLPAVLRRGRDHDRADAALERAGGPEPAGLVEEVLHLARHDAEPRRRREDDAVVGGQLLDGGDRRRLVELVIGGLRHLLGHEFGYALHRDLGALGARALGGGERHLFRMAPA
jgi:hypothetical protein